jgi:hypothetical protein
MRRLIKPWLLVFIGIWAGAVTATTGSAATSNSRVYVVAYPCAPKESGPVVAPGPPTVDLYDQAFHGDTGNPVALKPFVTVTKQTNESVEFYFDIKPGNYDAFIKFPTRVAKSMCGRNGPLIVLPGKDRHLFVATMTGITDGHAVAAVAGTLPMKGVDAAVLVYDHPMHCGDSIRSYDPKTFKVTVAPRPGNAIIDDDAYYQNIDVYGKQDHTIAVQFFGALFTNGAVLLTVTPDTSKDKPPFIIKNITTEMLHVATANPFDQKLICIDGF